MQRACQTPPLEILYRDLARTPLMEILYRDIALSYVAEMLPRRLRQLSFQESSYTEREREIDSSYGDLKKGSFKKTSSSELVKRSCQFRDLYRDPTERSPTETAKRAVLDMSCTGILPGDLLYRSCTETW